MMMMKMMMKMTNMMGPCCGLLLHAIMSGLGFRVCCCMPSRQPVTHTHTRVHAHAQTQC